MMEIKIVVDGIQYLVKSDDCNIYSILTEDLAIFQIKKETEFNIYFKWVDVTGYHSKLIDKVGQGIEYNYLTKN